MAKTVLIVDDDPVQRRIIQAAVERHGFAARLAVSGEEGLAEAGKASAGVDVVLLDLVMPGGMSGMETLEALMRVRSELPVIVLTASGGIDTVVGAMRAGAVDFFVKPVSPERIAVSIRNVLKMSGLRGEVTRLTRKHDGQMSFGDMIAESEAMQKVCALGMRGASSNIPVLILGESGVGKEVLARCIQGSSERSGGAFVSVNCGAIPESLVESTLFGHVKGAFTGAHKDSPGKFVEANGGTLFLDEIGDMPLDAQVKLLRALQEGQVDPVGGRQPVAVDVRIISATNSDLSGKVSEGSFREDLYYRLNVFPIEVPPLRERREDIGSLVAHFIDRLNAREGLRIQGVSSDTGDLLERYDWPGNVRQLENAVFRATILCDGDLLLPEHFRQLCPSERGSRLGHTKGASSTHGSVSVVDGCGEVRSLEAVERDFLSYSLSHYDGCMSKTADRLGIGRSTLYRKVRSYGLTV